MMTAEEIYKYIFDRVTSIQKDMDEMGFNADDMDEWEQGNFEAYTHLLSVMTRS